MSDPFDFEAKSDLYAVMGNPIGHSLSPQIHKLFAEQTHQRMRYQAIQVDPGGFPPAVGNFMANGGRGLNVTVPFKQEAWQLVDRHSERAQFAGAVNTIALGKDGLLYGDNTDGVGLVRDLTHHNIDLAGARILILGAGGAVRGILQPLLDQGPQELVIANRTKSRALELVEACGSKGQLSACDLEQLAEMGGFDLVINGTAASLQGEMPPLPQDLLNDSATAYDLMYGSETPFMSWSRQHGANVLDGLGMLVEQAAESFFIWRSVRPETQVVIQSLRS